MSKSNSQFARLLKVKRTHALAKELNIKTESYRSFVLDFFENCLDADLSVKGDLTTNLLPNPKKSVSAIILAKSDGIIAGLDELKLFLNDRIKVKFETKDGQIVKSGQIICKLKGPALEILKTERTILNFLQRMSGVATLMHTACKIAGNSVLIVPTRKTLWGLLDKKACLVGGGGTHRLNLSDAILVKDNHLEILNHDFGFLINKILKTNPLKLGHFVEIEVNSKSEAVKLVECFISRSSVPVNPLYVMLDNMSVAEVKQTINIIKKKGWSKNVFFEASGGIDLKNIKAYALAGVDIISLGMLTHSAKALDISLEIHA